MGCKGCEEQIYKRIHTRIGNIGHDLASRADKVRLLPGGAVTVIHGAQINLINVCAKIFVGISQQRTFGNAHCSIFAEINIVIFVGIVRILSPGIPTDDIAGHRNTNRYGGRVLAANGDRNSRGQNPGNDDGLALRRQGDDIPHNGAVRDKGIGLAQDGIEGQRAAAAHRQAFFYTGGQGNRQSGDFGVDRCGTQRRNRYIPIHRNHRRGR